MKRTVTFVVSDRPLCDELLQHASASTLDAHEGDTQQGFGESLYQILVDYGVTAIPVSVVTAWLMDAWQRRGSPDNTVIGVETDEQSDAIELREEDIEKIAQRLAALLNQPRDS